MADNNYNGDIDITKKIDINYEPKIITNSYYDNYANNDDGGGINNINIGANINSNSKTKFTYSTNDTANFSGQNHYSPYYTQSNNYSKNEIYEILRQFVILLNIKGNTMRIFGLDKMIVPLLIMLKNWLSSRVPFLNKYVFREKISSLTLSYTHFTSTYYNQQNNTSDCLVYRAILNYVYKKRPCGCKYSTNPDGNFMFFEQFSEVQINKYIWMISNVTNTNTSSVYTLELLSYNSSIEKINKFVKHCSKKFRSVHQDEGIVKSNIKYYKYAGINNTSHAPIFEEFPFIQTKTFNNIFFTGKDGLVQKINYFSKNENSYRELGIPWSMGILLSGKPGTGKTSCIKATASLTKRHIIDICLSKIKGPKELNDIFYNTKINGINIPFCARLYILDELDLIIKKIISRKNKNLEIPLENNINSHCYYNESNGNNNVNYQNYNGGGSVGMSMPMSMPMGMNMGMNMSNNPMMNRDQNQQLASSFEGVSLEDLLTILDGCVEQNGSLFMATTNYLHLIDKALTRPGRFDVCLCLDNSNAEIIEQMIEHFASKHPVSKEKLNGSGSSFKKITKEHHERIKKFSKFQNKNVWSPAKITQICLSHIDNDDYYDKVVKNLETEYEEQCKLLDD